MRKMANNHWLYSANTKIYDVFRALESETCWPINTKVELGDIVFLYISAPYKQLGFKCEVVEVDMDPSKAYAMAMNFMKQAPEENTKIEKRFMLLKPLASYAIEKNSLLSYTFLKENGLTGMLMGPRKLDNNPPLLEYILNYS